MNGGTKTTIVITVIFCKNNMVDESYQPLTMAY
jgi:hypothetical protein